VSELCFSACVRMHMHVCIHTFIHACTHEPVHAHRHITGHKHIQYHIVTSYLASITVTTAYSESPRLQQIHERPHRDNAIRVGRCLGQQTRFLGDEMERIVQSVE
jgi:hypothetical protein